MIEPVDMIQEVIMDKKGWENGQKYIENALWLKENFEEIEKHHKGKVVVVREQKVIFSTEKAKEARKKLRSLDTILRNQSYIFYIPNEKEMVLW